MRCPDCRCEFESLTIEGCQLDICPRCQGVWLDSG
jgi:Zn-finger nucleic acid-binding protein